MRKRETGFSCAWPKGGEVPFTFARADKARALAAWKGGQAFVDVTDCYGDPLSLRLGDIAAMGECTPEGWQRWHAEQRADRADDKAEELVDGE